MSAASIRLLKDRLGRVIDAVYVDRRVRTQRLRADELADRRVRCGGGYRIIGKSVDRTYNG